MKILVLAACLAVAYCGGKSFFNFSSLSIELFIPAKSYTIQIYHEKIINYCWYVLF
jgi:hypothetical protein